MTQPSKLSFSDVTVAQRTRDAIREIAKNEALVLGSNPNVGRVMSVDLAKLIASVWFPTDDAPVVVNMFPGSVPLDLGDYRTSAAYDTSAIGTGGLVYVENFRGKPYITRVLSGGEYQLNANVLGITHRMFNATMQGLLTGPPVTGDIYERHVNVLVNAGSAFVNGNCLLVGPWSGKNDGSSVDGIFELTMSYWVQGSVKNQVRKYTFSVSDRMIVDLEGDEGNKPFWMRILPHTNLGTSPHAELAIDVALVKTGIRTNLEFWFRLVPLDTWADQSVYFMSVRSFGSAFNVGDPRTGRLVMIRNTTTDPLQGWIGFNNAGMGWTEKDEMATFTRGTWFQGDEWSSGSWRSGAVRAAHDLARTWHTTGQWSWYDDTKSLFWEGNIVFSGIGPNYNALHNGNISVGMPTASIPVFPATPGPGTGNQIRSLDAFGRIPLNEGDTLYYALQPGSGTGGQSAGMYALNNLFFIVDNKNFNATNYNFSLPEWAIPIATRTLTVNGERRDVYIHSNNVDLNDTSRYTEAGFSSSHTGIVGLDETETITVDSFRYKKKTAYRVIMKVGMSSATTQVVLWRLKKGTTAAGAQVINFFRDYMVGAASTMSANHIGYFVNDTAADIVTQLVLTGQGGGSAATNWTRYGDSQDKATVRVEEAGPSSSYVGGWPALT
jgi:hypothetical protein